MADLDKRENREDWLKWAIEFMRRGIWPEDVITVLKGEWTMGVESQDRSSEIPAEDNEIVHVRRHWNDWRIAEARFGSLSEFHWSSISGGVQSLTPQPFIHAYVSCDQVEGDIAHSCLHGRGPHSIKVCIIKKDNEKPMWARIEAIVGPKPGRKRSAGS